MSRPDHAESSRTSVETGPGRPRSRKADERTAARRRRSGWPAEERARWSGDVVAALRALLPVTGPVASYAAMGDELDLGELHDRLIPTGRLCLPRVEGREMVMVPITAETRFVRSAFGVSEPEGDPIAPGALAAVIVPGLAFDRRGMRIGYGAGFYDRYLPGVAPGCPTIGVCFAGQLVASVPSDDHDVAVDLIVTEREVIEASRGPGRPPGR